MTRTRLPLLVWLALPLAGVTVAVNLVIQNPPDPLRPTDLPDGLGPVTRRRYWVDVKGAVRWPEEVAAEALAQLPRWSPPMYAWFRGLDSPAPPVRPGQRLRILMGGLRRARVLAEHADPLGFRIRTLRLHPDSGTVVLRVQPAAEAGAYRIWIESVVRASSRFDRLAYLLGVSRMQRATWEAVLTQAAAFSGGQIVDRGHATQEYPYRPEDMAP